MFIEFAQNDMIKPAVQGVVNVLTSCAKLKCVKRVVMTSSAAAVSINNLTGDGLVMNEDNWTNVDLLYSQKPPLWVLRNMFSYVFSYHLALGKITHM